MRAPIYRPPKHRNGERRRRKSLLLSFLGFGASAPSSSCSWSAPPAPAIVLWRVSKDLPDYESLAEYEPPVMTRIHAHDGSLIAEYARERRIFVPINTIPKRVIARLPLGRGQALLRARRPRHPGIARAVFKLVETKMQWRRPAHRGRLDHHPAGRQELPADERPHDRAQDQGSHSRHPHRARLLQGQDPRALSQRDLSRHRRLRRRRRRASPTSTRN